jgi:hypothetical protein
MEGVRRGIGLATLLVAAVLLGVAPAQSAQTDVRTSFESVRLDLLPIPKGPPPVVKFTRHIYANTTLAGVPVMLDACHGPISVRLGPRNSVLVAEHDYCGGSAWIPKLKNGDGVKLSGDGVRAGVYEVTEIRYGLRRKAMVKDMPRTDVVLQTCVTPTKLVLVGLEKF